MSLNKKEIEKRQVRLDKLKAEFAILVARDNGKNTDKIAKLQEEIDDVQSDIDNLMNSL